MMQNDDNSANDPQMRVIAKAWKDDGFHQELLDDPKATIEKELNVKLPEGLSVQVHEQSERVLHLLLPPRPEESELSDAQLEAVAGGGFNSQVGFNPQPEPPGMEAVSNQFSRWGGGGFNWFRH